MALGSEVVDIGSWKGQASHAISIRLSPLHLKLLVRVLTENLQRYEAHFGEIAVTQEMLEQHQARAHHIGFQPDDEPQK